MWLWVVQMGLSTRAKPVYTPRKSTVSRLGQVRVHQAQRVFAFECSDSSPLLVDRVSGVRLLVVCWPEMFGLIRKCPGC